MLECWISCGAQLRSTNLKHQQTPNFGLSSTLFWDTMASKTRLKTAFKKSKTIAPLHTNGPATITKDGTRLFTCLGEEVLLTNIASGTEICRFKGVSLPYMLYLRARLTEETVSGYYRSDCISCFADVLSLGRLLFLDGSENIRAPSLPLPSRSIVFSV